MIDGEKYVLEYYTDKDGAMPVRDWLRGIKDTKARQKIDVRLARLRCGQFGDVKSVGNGVHEIRVFVGKGYRLYFGNTGRTVILLLNGGDKQSKAQQNADIATAKGYLDEYKKRS